MRRTSSPREIPVNRESLNSKNDFGTFLIKENEQPRLSILNNFKSINRVMRSTFLKDPRDLQENQLERYNRVKELAKKMTGVMKHIAATSRFTAAPPSAYPPLRSPIPEYTITEQILPLSVN